VVLSHAGPNRNLFLFQHHHAAATEMTEHPVVLRIPRGVGDKSSTALDRSRIVSEIPGTGRRPRAVGRLAGCSCSAPWTAASMGRNATTWARKRTEERPAAGRVSATVRVRLPTFLQLSASLVEWDLSTQGVFRYFKLLKFYKISRHIKSLNVCIEH
jgi:hypothetical protein